VDYEPGESSTRFFLAATPTGAAPCGSRLITC
jgi:hypothetical protein